MFYLEKYYQKCVLGATGTNGFRVFLGLKGVGQAKRISDERSNLIIGHVSF